MSMGSGGIYGLPRGIFGAVIKDPMGAKPPQPQIMPGAGPSDYPITPGGPMTTPKPGINWWGVAADALAGAAGRPGPYAAMMQQRQDEAAQIAAEQRRQAAAFAAQDRAAAQPRFFQAPGGDYVRFDPTTGSADVVYDAPEKAPTPTALEQQINLLRKLRPEMTDAQAAEVVQRGIIGGQYDPNVYRPMVDYKAEVARATKAMPTYAQAHPKASSGGGRGGGKPSVTRVVGGKAYYKIGGRWYDNAEGR